MIYTTTPFDSRKATNDTLLIGIGPEIHTLAVIDQAMQLTFAASYTPGDADPEIETVLGHPFFAVKVSVADSRYTFIPSDVYDEQQHGTYQRYLPFDGVGTTHVADIPQLKFKMLYQCSRMGWVDLAGRFPDAGIFPQMQGMLNAVAVRGGHANEPLVVVERYTSRMAIVAFVGGEFLYAHDFEVYNEDNFTYHLAAVLEHLGLINRQPTIQLAGEIETNDGYYNRAAAFGGKTELADSDILTGIRIPDEVMPHQHRFLSLLGLYPCAS